MTYMLSTIYSCGCVDTFGPVVLPPPPDDVTHRIAEPCVPDSCQSCLARGRMCPDRQGLSRYQPVEFSEMLPAPRLTRRKVRPI